MRPAPIASVLLAAIFYAENVSGNSLLPLGEAPGVKVDFHELGALAQPLAWTDAFVRDFFQIKSCS